MSVIDQKCEKFCQTWIQFRPLENLGFSIGNGFGIGIQLWRLSFAQYKSNLELGVSSIFFVKHVLFKLEAWNFVRNF